MCAEHFEQWPAEGIQTETEKVSLKTSSPKCIVECILEGMGLTSKRSNRKVIQILCS